MVTAVNIITISIIFEEELFLPMTEVRVQIISAFLSQMRLPWLFTLLFRKLGMRQPLFAITIIQ